MGINNVIRNFNIQRHVLSFLRRHQNPITLHDNTKPHAVRVVRDLVSAKQIANVLPDLILIVHIWDET